MNFPFICSNIPTTSLHGVYTRDCGSYHGLLDRGLMLTKKLLSEGFLLVKLKSALRKFYSRHHDLVNSYTIDHGYVPLVVNTSRSFPHSWLVTGFKTNSNTTCATSGSATIYPSGVYPGFSGVRVARCFLYSVLQICCPFSFGHCVAFPSRLTNYDYPFARVVCYVTRTNTWTSPRCRFMQLYNLKKKEN